MGLDINVVFRLSSVKDLKNLTQALEQAVTLQAKIQLEDEIKKLSEQKKGLRAEVNALRRERRELRPPSEEEKLSELSELKEAAADEEEPSSFEEDSDRFIEQVTDEPTEEREEIVQSDQPPEAPG